MQAMALDPHLLPQLAFGLILAGGLYLFISERLRVDVTAMLILLAMVLTGVLDSKQALSGFASEPAIISPSSCWYTSSGSDRRATFSSAMRRG